MIHIQEFGIKKVLLFYFILQSFLPLSAQSVNYLEHRIVADSFMDNNIYDKAIKPLKRCIKLKDSKRTDYLDLAICHAKMNNLKKGLKYLDAAAQRGFRYSKIEDFENDEDLKPLKNSEKWFAIREKIVKNIAIYNKNIATGSDSLLLKELLTRRETDQKYRQLLGKGIYQGRVKDSLLQLELQTDKDNQIFVKNIIKKRGWLGFDLVGKEGDNAAWLIVQHADNDIIFQKEVLPIIFDACKKGNTNVSNYAYLYDRIKVNTNQKQLYGTQFSDVKDEKGYPIDLIFKPIEENERLTNGRRRYMFLATLEQYKKSSLEYFQKRWKNAHPD
jgi:hypothetical protein